MDLKRVKERYMVSKVGSFVVKERVLCFGEYAFCTYDRDSQQITNTWPYEDVQSASLMDGETDFIVHTPRHRIKKTVYRCHYRMDIVVTLLRMRALHNAKASRRPLPQELETISFPASKHHAKDVLSECTIQVRPDGIAQLDVDGDVMSHISYTSLVSIDLISDDSSAVVLNHATNSSLFLLDRRSDLVSAIHRVMKLYGMKMNEYRKKTLEAAEKDDVTSREHLSCQYHVLKASSSANAPSSSRILTLTEQFIIELLDDQKTIVSSRPLTRLYELILYQESSHAFELVFSDGISRLYFCEHREKIVAELLSSCRARGNAQVTLTTSRTANWMRVVPRRTLQAEAAKMNHQSKDLSATDKELRVVQGSILQQLATHGYTKTARVQRQLPRGLDETMHALALELNVNSATTGVYTLNGKPFEKAVFVVAREIHDVVGRHGADHEFVATYVETLARLVAAPTALKEFMSILVERGDDYLTTIANIFASHSSVCVYWMTTVIERLMASPMHELDCRKTLLGNKVIVPTLLTLLDDENPAAKDLQTMQVCRLLLLLLKTGQGKQQKLTNSLVEQLASRHRAIQRVLFSFPSLASVEACVGILTHLPGASGANMESVIASRSQQVPKQTFSFGENVNYGAGSHRGNGQAPISGKPMSGRHNVLSSRGKRNSFTLSRGNSYSSMSSASSWGTGVTVQNPEVLLQQYMAFLNAKCGALQQPLTAYDDAVYLRLRYRCKNIFLQELLSHVVGNFDEFRRLFGVECHQFSGFLGSSDGQREKSELFLTPRALICVRVINRHTHEFEYRNIVKITQATQFPDALMLTLADNKIRYVYSDQTRMLLQKVQELSGVVGQQIMVETVDELPPQPPKTANPNELDDSFFDAGSGFMEVQKRTGRHGFARFRRKKVRFWYGHLEEWSGLHDVKRVDVKKVRRVIAPKQSPQDAGDPVVSVEMSDLTRVVYAPDDMQDFLGAIYDACLEAKNLDVTFTHEFPTTNARLTCRSLLQESMEKYYYLQDDGFFVAAFSELTHELEKSEDQSLLALENMSMNVRRGDFTKTKDTSTAIAKFSFAPMMNTVKNLLEHACKPPVRTSDLAVALDAFCRVNDGCYMLSRDGGDGIVPHLTHVLVSGETLACVWAVEALHSLTVDASKTTANRAQEKRVRLQVFEHKKLTQLLVDLLDPLKPSVSLAVLQLFLDILVQSRQSTDNNQYEVMIRALANKYNVLLQLARAKGPSIGMAVAATCILKVIVENADAKARMKVCDAAMEAGVTLTDLYRSFFHPMSLGKETYQYLGAIWMTHHKPSYELLKRVVPAGFLRVLANPQARKKALKELQQGGKAGGKDGSPDAWFVQRMKAQMTALFPETGPGAASKMHENTRMNYPGETPGDLALLASLVHRDFQLPDVIWNDETRNELRLGLKESLDSLDARKQALESLDADMALTTSRVSWNHQQFQVVYMSLSTEPRVGNFYLRVLMEKIKDGSLKLDEVTQSIDKKTSKKLKHSVSEDVYFASMEIAKAPATFFHDVYQTWLENLHLTSILYYGSSGTSDGRRDESHYLSNRPMADEHCYWMLKILIELARVFPEARKASANRARFLLQLLKHSYLAGEVEDLVQLISFLTENFESATHFSSRSHVRMFLFLASLAHCRRVFAPSQAINPVSTDNDSIPLMDFKRSSSRDSLPKSNTLRGTYLRNMETARFNLQWRVKHVFGKDDFVIGGPFTVPDLRAYLDNDASSGRQNSLDVSVCCCSHHETMDADNHNWQPLFDVPELRWMELPDEPVDPYATSVHALQVVQHLLTTESKKETHKYVDLWPPSLADSVLSESPCLPMLTQLLLVDDRKTRGLVCMILRSLRVDVQQTLYQYGTFFFLFASPVSKTDTKSFVEEAILLRQIHRNQTTRERRAGQSYVLDLLPESLVGLLDTDTPEHFADVYTGRKTDKRVLWSSHMRSHLQEMLAEHLDSFTEELSRDVTAVYQYVPMPSVVYAELSTDVYCSGYYISNLVENEEELDAVEEPLLLLRSVEEKWRYLVRRQVQGEDIPDNASAYKVFGWNDGVAYTLQDLRDRYRALCQQGVEVTTVRSAFDALSQQLERMDEKDQGKTSNDVVDTILRAMFQLLSKFRLELSSFESTTLDLLLQLVVSTESFEGDTKSFRPLALQILHQMIVVAPTNIELLLDTTNAWDTLIDMVDISMRHATSKDKQTTLAILEQICSSDSGLRSLSGEQSQAVSTAPPLSSRYGTEDSMMLFSENDLMPSSQTFLGGPLPSYAMRILEQLDTLLLSTERVQSSSIQKHLYDIAASLCALPTLQNELVGSTRLFWKALNLILTSAEDEGVTNDEDKHLIESAFACLRAMSLGKDGKSRSPALDALANLLPVAFLDCLDREKGHDFITILTSEIREPTCIWNESTREELQMLAQEHCDLQVAGLEFIESAASYMYGSLETEPFVGGVYLFVLLEKADKQEVISPDTLYPSTAIEFVEALFMFLNENRDPGLAIYSDTLPALECLSLIADLPSFRPAFVDALEQHVDDLDPVMASISVSTLGRYLLPFDKDQEKDGGQVMSISSKRSLSAYGFKTQQEQVNSDGMSSEMERAFGDREYLGRQELALLILNKICGFEENLERMLSPFCQYTWSLQVITDHLDYEQAYYALACLAEICDTCLVVAQYVQSSGLWVEILGTAIQSRQYVLHEHYLRAEALREPAFEVLYALLVKDFALREKMYSGLCRFLPYPIVYQVHLDPMLAPKFFDDNHDKSDLIWNSHWRTTVRKKVDEIICRNRLERSSAKRDSVELNDETDYVRYPDNFVAGLYLDRFLSRPDPEKLTNAAYNLELLFQLWSERLQELMGFDLTQPPPHLKEAADEVEKLTTATTYILRADVPIEESIGSSGMPAQIVTLIRQCNKQLVTSFPYRCVLRLARRLVQFSEITSKDCLELLFCRMTMQHSDIPALLKLVRRILETRSAAKEEEKQKNDYMLQDVKYYKDVVKFLEGMSENKGKMENTTWSNVNRVLRIIKSEKTTTTKENSGILARSFMDRASARWHNFTLAETVKAPAEDTTEESKLEEEDIVPETLQSPDDYPLDAPPSIRDSGRSFDVDNERNMSLHDSEYDIDSERDDVNVFESVGAPPKSIKFEDGELEVEEVTAPPKSFRYEGSPINEEEEEEKSEVALPPSVRMPVVHAPPKSLRHSTIRAQFEPMDTQYHSKKAKEYKKEEKEQQRKSAPRRNSVEGSERYDSVGALSSVPTSGYLTSRDTGFSSQMFDDTRGSDMTSVYSGMSGVSGTSSRRLSLIAGSWKPPSTVASGSSAALTSLTISRRGRRAAAVYSRRKSKAPKRWFG